MSKTKLKSFHFDSELLEKLNKANFHNVEDVMHLPPLQLMVALNLSADEVDILLLNVSKACLPHAITAFEMSISGSQKYLPLEDPFLDSLLQGGLFTKMLTELAGPSGVGKTQVSLHLATQCLSQKGTLDKNSVCIIDTESTFKPQRILEMMEHSMNEETVVQLSKNIHVFQATTIESLSNILDSLEVLCIEQDIGLIILDSIASLARKEFSLEVGINRANLLASWAAQLKDLAYKMDVVMVVTNQVTSKLNPDRIYEDISTDAPDTDCTIINPALGNTWTHFVNTRMTLQYNGLNSRQIFITKSSVAPYCVKSFQILSSGISFNGEGSYLYENCDPLQHKIRAQPGFSARD